MFNRFFQSSTDLSTTDLSTTFNIFSLLPREIVIYVIAKYLNDKDLKACRLVSRHFSSLFSMPFKIRLEERITDCVVLDQRVQLHKMLTHSLLKDSEFLHKIFFQAVVFGLKEQAELMIQRHPALLLMNGTVTDYSHRIIKDSNPIRYALWAKDTPMLHMLFYYLTKIGCMDYAKKQLDEHREFGLSYQIKNESGELINVQNEQHFDLTTIFFTPLNKYLQLLNTYNPTTATSSETNALSAEWLKIKNAQRLFPAHLAQRYCSPGDGSFNHANDYSIASIFVRTLYFSHGKEHWYLTENFEGIIRGINGVGNEEFMAGTPDIIFNSNIANFVVDNRDVMSKINNTATQDLVVLEYGINYLSNFPVYQPYQISVNEKVDYLVNQMKNNIGKQVQSNCTII